MKIKAIRGTKDILPEEAALWCSIEEKTRNLCRIYGYREIRTPLLEEAHLFTRSIGKSSDIVRKQMYSFSDRKKRLLCLRPEATASVVRAYLEHGLNQSTSLAKFYYFGPMFRAERPQAGRLRQFHHIGVEAIGCLSPYLDAEVILLAVNLLRQLGIEGFIVQLNSIGCPKDRGKYKLILKQAIKGKLKLLCSDCLSRYKINLLRIFDCKNEVCKRTIRKLPPITDYFCSECAEHFLKLREILDSLNIAYQLNVHLVRGLDYYTKTCFEIIHSRLGAQNALGAGGRYDNLAQDLGGTPQPAIGFAFGIERIIAAMDPLNLPLSSEPEPLVYIASLDKQSRELAFKTLDSLRSKNIVSEMNYQDKSLKAQMRLANKLRFKYVVILGEQELKRKTTLLRDMRNKTQNEIPLKELEQYLK